MLLSLDSPEISDAVMQDASQQTSPCPSYRGLTGDGYAKARTALLPLGLTDSWEIALLQPHQLTTLPGLVPVLRNKMCLILDKLISDAERVQMVFERHHSWLEEHLGMEVAGSVASTFHRLCETLSCYKAMAVVQC